MYARNDSLYKLTRFLSEVFLYPFYKIDIEGTENLPETGAFILLPKHQRWVDIPIIAIAVPRLLYYIAKNEMFKNPASRWFISSVGGIPLNRKRPIESRRSLIKMMAQLGCGEGMVVFPEGTYFRNTMGPGNSGIIKFILSRQKLPIIPVGINYKKQTLREKVMVKFGKPIKIYDPKNDNLMVQIMKEIADLSGLGI